MKLKMKKHNFLQTLLPAVFAVILITFTSCSGIVSDFDKYDSPQGMGSISICLGENSRTAYPILGTDFSGWKWTLKYRASNAQVNDPWIILKEWAAGTVSAASGMNSPIGVPSGIWTFYLSGERIVGQGTEAQTVTTYSALGKYNDSTSINIAEAEATVSVNFNLVLTQLDTSISGNGSLSITVNYTSSKVASVKGGLFEVPSFTESENEEASLVAVTGYALENLTISGSSVNYSKNSVPAGKYIAGFWFYDSAGNKLNKNPVEEYVHIVNGGNSESTVTVSSLDDVYTITFVPAPSGSLPASFTRSSNTIKLPASTAIDSLPALDNSQTLFCGWYENSSFTGNPVTTIPAGTRGNKVFYGKYINAKEAQNLPDTLTLSYKDNGIAAGSTNSKKAYVGNTIEISSASSIVPTCTYQWFADTAENIEASSSAISGATQASYKLVNDNVGKAIKLKVSKTYAVTDHEEAGTLLYHVVTSGSETLTAVLKACDSSGNPTEDAATVDRAVLNLQNVTIQYSGKVVIGNKPNKANLILSGALNDIYGNSISSGNLTGDFSDYSALSSSKFLGVLISVAGYNVTNNSKNVFVTVQYAAPVGAALRTIEDFPDSIHGETSLGVGKVAFTYATSEMSGLQYSTDGSSWTDVSIDQFDKPNNLYVRYNSTGTAGQNGYIMASNSVTVPVTVANVGTQATSQGETVTVEDNVVLLSGEAINDLFVANRFNNANSFEYTTSAAPTTAVTISDEASTAEVVVWKSGRKIYVTAKNFDGQIPLPKNSSGLFEGMNFKTIDLSHFCTKVPEEIPEDYDDWYDFSKMFMDCYSLESIEFADDFDTSTVSTMKSMFENTGALESIDLSHFDTGNVTDMSSMFAGSGIIELDLSGFNTSKVTNMSSMFSQSYIEEITFGEDFDVSKVTNMALMFADTYLVTLNLSSFDTRSAENMDSMFAGMNELTEIDLSGDTFVVTNVTSVRDMFNGCINLNKIYVKAGTDWSGTVGETSTTRTGAGMFTGCDSLVGGNGAVFDDAAVGISMANTTASGYFTAR